MGFLRPKVPRPAPPPQVIQPAQEERPVVQELEQAAEERAREDVAQLRRGRVRTILTSGQGLAGQGMGGPRRTVLGG